MPRDTLHARRVDRRRSAPMRRSSNGGASSTRRRAARHAAREAIAAVRARSPSTTGASRGWRGSGICCARQLEGGPDALALARAATRSTRRRSRSSRMAWRDDIHESWRAPTIVMDATMQPEIVRQFFPQMGEPVRAPAPMPHTRVRQITDRAMSAAMLIETRRRQRAPQPVPAQQCRAGAALYRGPRRRCAAGHGAGRLPAGARRGAEGRRAARATSRSRISTTSPG